MQLTQQLKWPPTRPFSTAHWSLTVALVVLWLFILFTQQCHEGPYYLEACAATATIMLALWMGDRAVTPKSGWRRFAQILATPGYDLLSLCVLVLLLAIPFAIFLPSYQCYTPRARVSETILAASSYRSRITERIELSNSLRGVGDGLSVKAAGKVAGGFISADGTIVMLSEDPAAFVVLTPSIERGVVKWQCAGLPVKYMPARCSGWPTTD